MHSSKDIDPEYTIGESGVICSFITQDPGCGLLYIYIRPETGKNMFCVYDESVSLFLESRVGLLY